MLKGNARREKWPMGGERESFFSKSINNLQRVAFDDDVGPPVSKKPFRERACFTIRRTRSIGVCIGWEKGVLTVPQVLEETISLHERIPSDVLEKLELANRPGECCCTTAQCHQWGHEEKDEPRCCIAPRLSTSQQELEIRRRHRQPVLPH